MNPFSSSYQSDENDASLIERILGGDRTALDNLIGWQ